MKNSLLVVNYHYIREVFPESGIKGITPKEFKLQIETIYKEKFKFIGLTELHDIILNDKKQKIYQFKPIVQTLQDKQNALNELNALIIDYNGKLDTNKTLGKNGTYTINGSKKSSSIPNPI